MRIHIAPNVRTGISRLAISGTVLADHSNSLTAAALFAQRSARGTKAKKKAGEKEK